MNTKHKYPSDWSFDNIAVIEGGWMPQVGDDCHMYVRGNKVEAVVEAYDGKTITFNYIARTRDGKRAVLIVRQEVRFGR
jgi:hypothetical protein